MKQSRLIYIVLYFIIIAFCGCNNDEKSIWGNAPKGAERIYESGITSETTEFELAEDKDADGSKCVRVCHKSFAESELYQLYSPNGNLRVVASGAQEQCGIDGYRIDYDKNGRVCNVTKVSHPSI